MVRPTLEFSLWHVTDGQDSVMLQYHGGSPTHATRSIIVHNHLAYEVYIFGKKVVQEWQPCKINNIDDIKSVMAKVISARVCIGNSHAQNEELMKSRLDGETFHGKDGTVTAVLEESWVPGRCIRTSVCPIVVEIDIQCGACSVFSATLRKARSRQSNRTAEDRTTTAHAFLSRAELSGRLHDSQGQVRTMKRHISRLEERQERMVEVANSNEYASIFEKLQVGMDAVKEKAENPCCQWNNCKKKCSTITELIIHLKQIHIKMDSGCHQLLPTYTCQWKNCTHAPFKNKKIFTSHIRTHTGKESDSFLAILLQDQAKALSVPSAQMRWHPSVLRWCLQQYGRSRQQYEHIQSSGFLKLPSGRTLLRYQNLCHPDSGWQPESLAEMRAQFDVFLAEKKGKPDRSHYGAFYFDEMTIKEGLVWDQRTNELVGFADDIDDDSWEDSEGSYDSVHSMLAKNVLQFHWRSLFSRFTYPCAFFYTRNLKAHQLDNIFWDGVTALQNIGLKVLLTVCDGASCNRSFMNLNLGSSCVKHNPVTNTPLFFMSDPPHLVKKLRNNLSRSGFGKTSSRLLTINGDIATWSQIREVYERDSARQVHFTKLRDGHINLNSYSQMRSQLAYDIFDWRTEADMKDNVPDRTVAIRQYLHNVRTLVSVYDSREPLFSVRDDRLKVMDASMSWFRTWKKACEMKFPGDKAKQSKMFISWQVYEDLERTYDGFKGMEDWNCVYFPVTLSADIFLDVQKLPLSLV